MAIKESIVHSEEELKKIREIAITLVHKKVQVYNQYSVVHISDVIDLLENGDLVHKLVNDPIKGVCPAKDLFYYWNVVDYLVEAIKLESNNKRMLREIAASEKVLTGFGSFKVSSCKMPQSVQKILKKRAPSFQKWANRILRKMQQRNKSF